MMHDFLYQPYYCEENIWQLAQHPECTQTPQAFVLFLSNANQSCALWHQRAAASPSDIVVWDYHVILLAFQEQQWMVWDLDTDLGTPCPAFDYLQHTFSGVEQWPTQYHPMFRLIPRQEYVQTLSTDRSHMLDAHGQYRQPPPPWSAPYHPQLGMNLMQFVDLQQPFLGECLSLPQLREKISSPHQFK